MASNTDRTDTTLKSRPVKSSLRSEREIAASDGQTPPAIPLDLWDPAIQKRIEKLIGEINPENKPFANKDIIQEIMVTALKAVQSQIGRGDLKLLSRAMRELRYAFKIFQSYRQTPKVTIFGSARTKPSNPAYKLAHAFSRQITKNGFMVITGAGPGIMAAGNHGATRGSSFGVNIRLPFEQSPNRFIANEPTYIDCRYFFTRKLVFVKETNAVAVFPGGFGTLDEAFEILTLVQTGKSNPIPILLVDTPKGRMWSALESFIKNQLMKNGMISKEDLSIYKIVRSADEATKEILSFYSNYHSIRYVKDLLVMRLQKPIENAQLSYINRHFRDILSAGKFFRSAALLEERNEPELDHLPRLVGKFNRINNGRLRLLIDYMNRP